MITSVKIDDVLGRDALVITYEQDGMVFTKVIYEYETLLLGVGGVCK